MAKRGAKNKYETLVKPYLTEINEKIRQGVTEAEIAKALGISVASLNNYRNQYPEFAEALSKDKGIDVLNELVNAGIEAAKGYYKEIETTVIILDEDGKPAKRQKTIQRQWFPANPALNKFYVLNFGKEQGYVSDPLEFELKKAKQEFDELLTKKTNWHIDFDK
jgi:DNA-binding NarL/FixJ family response regulator